jgi:predicted nucleic acid-binding protein
MDPVILVDTSVLIDLLQGLETLEAGFLEWQLRENPHIIVIADFSFLEILQGIRNEKTIKETVKALRELTVVSPSGPELMIKTAENYRLLRKKGITVRSMIDCLIATFVLEKGWFLLHRDRDFKPFEKHLGLRNPL